MAQLFRNKGWKEAIRTRRVGLIKKSGDKMGHMAHSPG